MRSAGRILEKQNGSTELAEVLLRANLTGLTCGLAFVVLCLIGNPTVRLVAGDNDTQSRRIDLPVPIGHDVKGLHLPVRNDQGKMDMLFDVETARRIDEQNIRMETSVIQTYNQQTEKPDAKIYLKNSTMNLDSEVITTKDPVRVTRDDFVLTADSGEFNSKTRHGVVYGNIRLVIYNRKEFQTKSDAGGQQGQSQ
jgi:hypothetical protein